MLKTLTTLLRGSIAEAEEAVLDANAIRMLEQQMRDAAAALENSKRELACAMAHQSGEQRAIQALDERIAELETGAREALEAGRDDLAEEAAVVIAVTEDERNDRKAAVDRFAVDIRRLRMLSEDGRLRLSELRRGLELARAQDALRRAGANGRRALATGTGALREAEATLHRIRERHCRDDDAAAALDELERSGTVTSVADRLAAAGFGPNLKTRPHDVLARLRASRNADSGGNDNKEASQ